MRRYEYFIKNRDDSRRRYFEQYHRCDDRKRRKLELSFFKTVEQLREFEAQITAEQWELVKAKKWTDYGEDSTYSSNHQLIGPDEVAREWIDSMIAATQLNRRHFGDDRDASTGTMEDYKKYQQEKSA